MALKEELLKLVRTDLEVREAIRREIVTDDLLAMPGQLGQLAAAQLRTEERVGELAAAQLRTEERVGELAAAQLRTEERLETLTACVEALTTRVDSLVGVTEDLAHAIQNLEEWRRGEQGRREGERYERDTVRHADAIFGGGRGAVERPEDLEQIRRALAPVFASPPGLAEADNPLLANILWAKGERIAVVEVSRQVDLSDIERAEGRAGTLRRAGLSALGIVVGRDWASEEAERAARGRSIDWRVGEDISAGYLEFRGAPAG